MMREGLRNDLKYVCFFLGYFNRASDISRDFQGQTSGKIGPVRLIFAGEKSKFAEKSADFTGNVLGKLRQETISKKQPISLDVFGKFR